MPMPKKRKCAVKKWFAIVMLCPAMAALGQVGGCPAVERVASAADAAYGDGQFSQAEGLYRTRLVEEPGDVSASVGLVRTLLREGSLPAAAAQASQMLAAKPEDAGALTSEAEVELKQGEPWLAMETVNRALAGNACAARAHLVRSGLLRLDSMYAAEREEIARAYAIDPGDADVARAWNGIVAPAEEITSIREALATAKDLDPDVRAKAEASAAAMLPLLTENSQTCKVLPTDPGATLALMPVMPDPKHIEGYELAVRTGSGPATLMMDTAASGLFVTRTLASANGWQHEENDPAGTVRLDELRIGPLMFRNCMVGVTDTGFPGKADGFIGTDMFAQYLITVDFRQRRMRLDALPAVGDGLPGDRMSAPELEGFVPVYHRRHYLLLPVAFPNGTKKLFVLASGMRSSAMTLEAAHAESKMTMNFTNAEPTASGGKMEFYREVFDLQMASLTPIPEGHMVEMDLSAQERNAGFQIAGMLGLDVLHGMTMMLDYRDGLVKLEPKVKDMGPGSAAGNLTASTEPVECPQLSNEPIPIRSMVQAKVTGGLDSGHLKVGKEIWLKVMNGWDQPDCRVYDGATIYGHVTAVSASKDPASAELSLVFDHADCVGHPRKAFSLFLVGVVGMADAGTQEHDAMPVEVSGGGRQIQSVVNGTFGRDDALNPGGLPNTLRPGILVRVPKATLEPTGGPGCSARITTTQRSFTLGPGAEMLFLVRETR